MNEADDDLIDRQLREAFAPPAPAHFAAVARSASGVRATRWPWLLAAAAAAVLLGIAFAFARERPARGPEGHDGRQLGALWAAAYDHAITTGFGVGSCCQQGHDLALECERFCGQRLSFAGPDGISLLGCYGGLPTGGCLGLMVQLGGDPVCVFVVPRGDDPQPILPAAEDLVLVRRDLGPLVLYAVSHRQPQAVLDAFSLPRP